MFSRVSEYYLAKVGKSFLPNRNPEVLDVGVFCWVLCPPPRLRPVTDVLLTSEMLSIQSLAGANTFLERSGRTESHGCK